MRAYILPTAVAPLRVQEVADGYTVWDANSVVVLRSDTKQMSVPTYDEAQFLVDHPALYIDIKPQERWP